MSLPHITIQMLESSSFTGLSKQVTSRHCATSLCFFFIWVLKRFKCHNVCSSCTLLYLWKTSSKNVVWLLCFLIILALYYLCSLSRQLWLSLELFVRINELLISPLRSSYYLSNPSLRSLDSLLEFYCPRNRHSIDILLK